MNHQHDHRNFLIDVGGKIGPPMFAATMVACLLAGRMQLSHLALMAIGVFLIALDHWYVFHRKPRS